ncbi:MAG: carboxynorspermidine decarboxylase [Desulfovibrio sp.]|jgi:carboxynorspermidine decarboxylase|nr:carboxynorspermidine decarboxylase [Desulfovibrio sp.]
MSLSAASDEFFSSLPSPCFVVDEDRLAANLAVLNEVRERCGARILLALKAFAMFSVFPLLRASLDGVCASSPHEARLGREEFCAPGAEREVHVFAAAYSEADVEDAARFADHIIFNSPAQLERLGPKARKAAGGDGRSLEFGLRLNPEHSEVSVPLYDPCAPGSHLGTRVRALKGTSPARLRELGVSGLHFHALCEQDAAPLVRTLDAVEEKFGEYLPGMRWLNCGGGHHITRPGYDLDLLCGRLAGTARKYGLQIYLEPGEAVALNAGVLVSTVLDIVYADMPVAVLDTSAAAHMPDVLEMPYRPEVAQAGYPGEKAWSCRLAGKSCLAGDVMGEYSFAAPLTPGDKVIFLDMAHYSMVKTSTFNGLNLPGIAVSGLGGQSPRLVREFGYDDFKTRLS